MDIKELLKTEWQNVQQLRYLRINYEPARCNGCWQCYEVCPTGRWSQDFETRLAVFSDPELCVACGACVLQCPQDAIELVVHK